MSDDVEIPHFSVFFHFDDIAAISGDKRSAILRASSSSASQPTAARLMLACRFGARMLDWMPTLRATASFSGRADAIF